MNTNKLVTAKKDLNTIQLGEVIKSSFEKYDAGGNTRISEADQAYAFDFNALIDLIVTRYHYNLKGQAILIYDLSNNLFRSDGYLYPHLSKLVEHFFMFFRDLIGQFEKEEKILFPNIIHLAEKRLHEGAFDYSSFGMVTEYADEMKKQHRSMLKNLVKFRELTSDYKIIEGDCRSYMILMDKMQAFENELITHIHLEEDVLIAKATRLDEN
jgi:regulator of cell morphogenesis and NO signaling